MVGSRLPSFYIHRWGYSDQVWNNISPKGLSTLLNKNCNFNRLSWPLTGKFKIKNALIRQSISICILIGRLRFSSSGFAHHLFNQKIFFIKIYAKILRCESKKVSKFRWKIYLTKSCQIWLKLSHFLDKASGKNMQTFQPNRTTFTK